MSELQEITTTDLEKKISPDNESIILSEKEEDSDLDSDLDNDSFDMPGDENIAIVPPRPPIGSENYINSFLVNTSLVAPLICYESVYGDMDLGKTNLLAIITNDGWWKNTAGYKQHLNYARLRAIEQRKSVVRSANTGISSVINSRGDVLQKSNWDEVVCMQANVSLSNTNTVYSQLGDYIGRVSVFIAIIFLIMTFVKVRLSK